MKGRNNLLHLLATILTSPPNFSFGLRNAIHAFCSSRGSNGSAIADAPVMAMAKMMVKSDFVLVISKSCVDGF